MNCGDTLLIPAPGSGPISHLWIIVTKPCPTTHRCVLANITTLRNAQDQTVTLGPADHPFIRHQSAIRYSDAQIADVRTLRHDLAAGIVVAHKPCSPATIGLVQAGILASPYTPKKIQTFCQELWRLHGR
jgi:hypothetical protein